MTHTENSRIVFLRAMEQTHNKQKQREMLEVVVWAVVGMLNVVASNAKRLGRGDGEREIK